MSSSLVQFVSSCFSLFCGKIHPQKLDHSTSFENYFFRPNSYAPKKPVFLSPLNQGFRINELQNSSLTATTFKVATIRDASADSRSHLRQGRDLTERSGVILANARGYFHTLDEALSRLDLRGQKLSQLEGGLSAVVENYRSKFVLPCRANSEQLLGQADRLQRMFQNMVGVNAEQALQVTDS